MFCHYTKLEHPESIKDFLFVFQFSVVVISLVFQFLFWVPTGNFKKTHMNIFMFWLVVDRVNSTDGLQETVQIRMGLWIVGGFKKRRKYAVQKLIKIVNHLFGFVDVTKNNGFKYGVFDTKVVYFVYFKAFGKAYEKIQ